jgi:dihydropteroate synthase
MDYREYVLHCGDKKLILGREPVIMGILNVTPNSFSDGGRYAAEDQAVEHGLAMVSDGAGIIDVGGESTRPGSEPVPPAEQIRRVVGVTKTLARQIKVPISIDTASSEVARAGLDAGATIINDISACRFDDQMAPLAAKRKAPLILMHMQGTPQNMQQHPHYEDLVKEVKEFLTERIAYVLQCGMIRDQVIVDPGIGFGKTVAHNLELVRRVAEFHEMGTAILMGTSRKSFIGKVLEIEDPLERIFGTAATMAWCVSAGVQILRVHDIRAMREVARMTTAIRD